MPEVMNQNTNLDVLLEVPVRLTVEIGSCHMSMRDVLELEPGSVVKLDKEAESLVDIFVNQKKIAEGEVVVVEDRFGIKITSIEGVPETAP